MNKINNRKKYILTVFAMILTSGANILIRNISSLVMCVVLLLIRKENSFRIRKDFFARFCFLTVFVWIDSCILNTAPTDYKECVMMTIRLACCAIIAQIITLEEYRKYFLRIIVVLAIFSLFCFAFYLLFRTLPGITVREGWVGAFYHTVGHGYSLGGVRRIRNCGIFGEPGLYQMYLNLGLIALLEEKEINLKKQRIWFMILSITVLTTLSSMGFIIYGFVLVLCYIKRREFFPKGIRTSKKGRLVIISSVALIILAAELNGGKITQSVLQTNSFASRYDDTLISFAIAKDYPLFGIGLATNAIPIWDIYYSVYESMRMYKAYQNAMSNGIGNYAMMGGIAFTVIYFVCIVKAFKRVFNINGKVETGIMTIILLLIAMEEPYLSTPFFIICFYYSIKKPDEKRKVAFEGRYSHAEIGQYKSIMDCIPANTTDIK